jgi:23S rRNA (cytosine1962-C5)-methyltransferase
MNPALVIHEDAELLVVNKPAGLNTHAPSPFAGEGLYEWLKHREPRWAALAIIHRLDKETSGVMVFGKTPRANKSLTEQFTRHAIHKKYVLLTDRPVKIGQHSIKSAIVRVGDKYTSRPVHAGAEIAETHFRAVKPVAGRTLVEAEPLTGRTHQIRVHAAALGFPVLGDVLYGGSPAPRVCLHAAEIELRHPSTGEAMKFSAPVDFEADVRFALRAALINPDETNAFRLIHGAADGWPGLYVDRLGDFLLAQSERALTEAELHELARLLQFLKLRGAYHKVLSRRVRGASAKESSPKLILGETAPAAFNVRENGAAFELSFAEGYSVGLFLDQRENRRRLLTYHIAADFPLFVNGTSGATVLNTFAYTCGFSVCAAKAGARATSLDLSKKYLEWGKRNFALNGLDPAAHDFIFGDAFEWFRRLAKQSRAFDLILLDPPTFSQSRAGGVFQAEKDFGRLAAAALPLLKPGGVLFASTNAARLEPETFLKALEAAVGDAKRAVERRRYVPQPPDFPISRDEPAHLKTVWVKFKN